MPRSLPEKLSFVRLGSHSDIRRTPLGLQEKKKVCYNIANQEAPLPIALFVEQTGQRRASGPSKYEPTVSIPYFPSGTAGRQRSAYSRVCCAALAGFRGAGSRQGSPWGGSDGCPGRRLCRWSASGDAFPRNEKLVSNKKSARENRRQNHRCPRIASAASGP